MDYAPRTLRRPPPPLVAEAVAQAAAERMKVREEIAALKAEVAAISQRLEDQKTLKSFAVFQRLQAETSLRRWKVLALALGALAAIGWIF